MKLLNKDRIVQGLSVNYSIIEIFDEVDSTNDVIKTRQYFHPNSLILSRDQSKGIRTNGRSFYCEKDKGIYASCVVDTNSTTHAPSLLPIVMGLTLVQVLNKHGIDAHVKWVNDVLIDSKKVAGILCEQKNDQPLMVVGVGVNVYPIIFPNDLEHQCSYCQLHTNQELDINQLVVELFNEFNRNLYVESQVILDEYCKVSNLINKQITFVSNHNIIKGIVKTIDKSGALIVTSNDKDFRIISTNQIMDY